MIMANLEHFIQIVKLSTNKLKLGRILICCHSILYCFLVNTEWLEHLTWTRKNQEPLFHLQSTIKIWVERRWEYLSLGLKW